MIRGILFIILAGAAIFAVVYSVPFQGEDDSPTLGSERRVASADFPEDALSSADGRGVPGATTREPLAGAYAGESGDSSSGRWDTWRGSITIFDHRGEARPPADGRIHVAEAPNRPILVHRGRWERGAFGGSESTIVGIEIGDIQARARSSRIAFGPGELALEADLQYSGDLRVVDGETGRDLEGVTLCIADGPRTARMAIPPIGALDRPVVNDVVSPLPVPHTPGVQTYWAHAPGYAWRAFSFSGAGGMRTVALEPGGDARVMLAGTPPLDGRLDVHIEDMLGNRLLRRVAVGTGLALTGLPAQPLQAVVVMEQLSGPDRRIATSAFQVVAGERVEVNVDFAEMPELPDYGSLEVLIGVATPTELPIEVLRLARVAQDGRRVDAHAVDAEDCSELPTGNTHVVLVQGLVPGTWHLDTWPFGAPRTLEIRPGTHLQVEQTLPALTQLVVWPRDASDGRSLEVDEIAWRPIDGTPEWQMDRAVAARDHWTLAPPVGAVEISVTRDGYRTVLREVDCAPGSNDIAVDLEPIEHCEIEVSLAMEDAEFPVQPDFWTGARFEGPGSAVSLQLTGFTPGSRSTEVARATFKVDAPGRYVVDFPEVPGYTQDFSGTVDASSGRTARLHIALHSER
ncbi:MAG: hypothetical protein GY711_29075 [bacterium]|nr:hypothetical protein [bacterium]